MERSVAIWEVRGDDSRLPLLVGLLFALLLHALLLPRAYLLLTRTDLGEAASAPEVDQVLPMPRKDEWKAGDPESVTSSVAWIAHDAFEELIARQSTTLQPALQQEVEPVEDAPPELDPTPPAAQAPESKAPQPVQAARLPTPSPGASASSVLKGIAEPLPDAKIAVGDSQDAGGGGGTPTPSDQNAQAAASPAEARPTSAAKSDREAMPTMLKLPAAKVKPGRVIAGPGIEIKTFAPDISAIASVSSARAAQNPVAVLTFSSEGTVRRVRLKRSAGADNLDAPIIASLYRWKASGKKVEATTESFDFEVTLILVRE